MGALWHPDAVRRVHQDAGAFQGGGRKLVWHTTETSGLPNYGGSAPHFTLDPATGRLWQHIPLDRAGRALKAGGPNFWNTVQVELLGFARETHTWPASHYERVAGLARWIEANFGVPRNCSVKFVGNGGTDHLASLDAVKKYAGHLGHQHVRGNDHWDPGLLKIDLVLEGNDDVRDLGRGDRGPDVEALQRLLVKRGYRVLEPQVDGTFRQGTEACLVHFQWKHGLNVDGVAGARTRAALGLQTAPEGIREADGLELGLGEPLEDHAHVLEPAGAGG